MSSARVRAADRARTGKLIAFLSIVALAVMPIVGYLIWSGYQAAIHGAETTTRDYAAILEARLEATLRRVDADLRDLSREIPKASPVFSEVVTGRIVDRPILVIARALTDARGNFVGVVFAPLELDH